MTYIALRFSRYVNGVAMQHGKVSQQMFPDYNVHSITNGVHAATWLSEPFQALLDTEIPEWRHDNQYFRSVYGIAPAKIANCHEIAKLRLFAEVARRVRPALQSQDPHPRLCPPRRHLQARQPALPRSQAPRQARRRRSAACRFCSPAKPIPPTTPAKGLIRDVFAAAASLKSSGVRILYLENYDWELGALLTQGVDVWVNTPRRPYEASGTSGMKAALNGVPSPQRPRWLVDRGLRREHHRLGHRRRATTKTAKPPASTTSSKPRSRRSTPVPTPGRGCSSTASPSTARSSTPTACLASTSQTPTSRRCRTSRLSPSRSICWQTAVAPIAATSFASRNPPPRALREPAATGLPRSVCPRHVPSVLQKQKNGPSR